MNIEMDLFIKSGLQFLIIFFAICLFYTLKGIVDKCYRCIFPDLTNDIIINKLDTTIRSNDDQHQKITTDFKVLKEENIKMTNEFGILKEILIDKIHANNKK